MKPSFMLDQIDATQNFEADSDGLEAFLRHYRQLERKKQELIEICEKKDADHENQLVAIKQQLEQEKSASEKYIESVAKSDKIADQKYQALQAERDQIQKQAETYQRRLGAVVQENLTAKDAAEAELCRRDEKITQLAQALKEAQFDLKTAKNISIERENKHNAQQSEKDRQIHDARLEASDLASKLSYHEQAADQSMRALRRTKAELEACKSELMRAQSQIKRLTTKTEFFEKKSAIFASEQNKIQTLTTERESLKNTIAQTQANLVQKQAELAQTQSELAHVRAEFDKRLKPAQQIKLIEHVMSERDFAHAEVQGASQQLSDAARIYPAASLTAAFDKISSVIDPQSLLAHRLRGGTS